MIWDKYCEWRGLNNKYNKKRTDKNKLNDIDIAKEFKRINIKTPIKALSSRKKFVKNLRAFKPSNTNIIERKQEEKESQIIENDDDIFDLDLRDVITNEFTNECEIKAKGEMDYYLAKDYTNISGEKWDEIMENPMCVFQEDDLQSNCSYLSNRVAPRHLKTLESEGGSERQYSDAGHIITPLRSLLIPETTRSLQLERLKHLRELKIKEMEEREILIQKQKQMEIERLQKEQQLREKQRKNKPVTE